MRRPIRAAKSRTKNGDQRPSPPAARASAARQIGRRSADSQIVTERRSSTNRCGSRFGRHETNGRSRSCACRRRGELAVCSTRSSFACNSSGSRRSRREQRAAARRLEPSELLRDGSLNAPRSWPNSSVSAGPREWRRSSRSPGRSHRPLRSWIARAISSFPVPVCPDQHRGVGCATNPDLPQYRAHAAARPDEASRTARSESPLRWETNFSASRFVASSSSTGARHASADR